eukprot:m.10978 g.10978  ORF g.10978 m.10978 type:complete len:332 (+) comp14611_c0_seq1:1573-2568(+)
MCSSFPAAWPTRLRSTAAADRISGREHDEHRHPRQACHAFTPGPPHPAPAGGSRCRQRAGHAHAPHPPARRRRRPRHHRVPGPAAQGLRADQLRHQWRGRAAAGGAAPPRPRAAGRRAARPRRLRSLPAAARGAGPARHPRHLREQPLRRGHRGGGPQAGRRRLPAQALRRRAGAGAAAHPVARHRHQLCQARGHGQRPGAHPHHRRRHHQHPARAQPAGRCRRMPLRIERRAGPGTGRRAAAGPHPAGHRPARQRRLSRLQAAARRPRPEPGAHHVPDPVQHHRPRGARAGLGRRRLRAQALQRAGAVRPRAPPRRPQALAGRPARCGRR